jgi:hypothetical protein
LILALALVLRLAYALSQDHALAYRNTGGDSAWYLRNGYQLVTDTIPASPPTAPLYLVFIGLPQAFVSPEAAVVVIRMVQALMGAATCYFAYRLASILAKDERAGLLAAGALAISPAFIMETAQIQTETLYIFLVSGALLAYISLVIPTLSMGATWQVAPTRASWLPPVIVVALLLGLATLTRAVLLLFPLALAAHLGWRAGWKRGAVLLAVYTLVVSIWTVYNAARWQRLVIGAEGYAAFLYVGATGWQDPFALDERLMEDAPELAEAESLNADVRQDAFTQAAGEAISRNPLGWLRRRISELASAYLQPYGTAFFPGESLKQLAGDWLRQDRSLGGLLALTGGEAFWPKLSIYFFHYVGLCFGAAGMWICRRQWRTALPLIGFVLYTTLVHLPLLALPRYIFPTEVVWWIFASIGLLAVGDWLLAKNRRSANSQLLKAES